MQLTVSYYLLMCGLVTGSPLVILFLIFFTDLFASAQPCFPHDLQDLVCNSITAETNSQLTSIPTAEEVLLALNSMSNFKSPGLDGFNSTFFKQYWGIVGAEIQQVFRTGKLKPAFNHTFIALIPKTASANRMDQYRPIALCNVVFKLITKIISSRLRPILDHNIHPCQAAFIPNRSIGDNVLINHEVMYFLNKKKGRLGYMAIKLNLAKAYDRIEWGVLVHILSKFGFSSQFTDLILECISTTKLSLLLNGSPFGYFSHGRGLRQGDPMSSTLFTIFSDLLSRLLTRAEQNGLISGVKLSRLSPKVTHLMYADDLVIYTKATPEEATHVSHCLRHYCHWTGQAINWHKSAIHFSSNTPTLARTEICHTMGIQECQHKETYLGHPFCKFKSKSKVYKVVLEKMENKISGWKKRALSMAGHTVLIKSMVQAVPLHVMQSFLLSHALLKKMDRRIKNFFWGFDDTKPYHLHLKSWKSICQPKSIGGLGIQLMGDFNVSLLTKRAW